MGMIYRSVAPIMIENNVQCIGVTNNQELKEVRDLGFKGRLMRVRNATEQRNGTGNQL